MKKISVLFGTLLFAGLLFSFTTVKSQGIILADQDFAYLWLGCDNHLAAETYNWVYSDEGDLTLNVTWQLSEGNEYIPEHGNNKVSITGFLDHFHIVIFGHDIYIINPLSISTDDAMVNKHGKCHAVFHINGAGNGF